MASTQSYWELRTHAGLAISFWWRGRPNLDSWFQALFRVYLLSLPTVLTPTTHVVPGRRGVILVRTPQKDSKLSPTPLTLNKLDLSFGVLHVFHDFAYYLVSEFLTDYCKSEVDSCTDPGGTAHVFFSYVSGVT